MVSAEAVAPGPVKHAVAVEVNDVVGLARVARALQLGLQGGEGGRVEDGEPGQITEGGQRLDERAGADAVVNVGNVNVLGVLLWSRADEQDAERGGGGERVFGDLVGQAAAHAHTAGTLEEVVAVVVGEFPRK